MKPAKPTGFLKYRYFANKLGQKRDNGPRINEIVIRPIAASANTLFISERDLAVFWKVKTLIKLSKTRDFEV